MNALIAVLVLAYRELLYCRINFFKEDAPNFVGNRLSCVKAISHNKMLDLLAYRITPISFNLVTNDPHSEQWAQRLKSRHRTPCRLLPHGPAGVTQRRSHVQQ